MIGLEHLQHWRGKPRMKSSVGVMSTLTPMVAHQHPSASSPHPHPHPHPHGWVQFQHASYLHQPHQAAGIPMPISSPGRFDTQRSMPRLVPSGQVYEPNHSFSHFAGSSPRNYSHVWSGDIVPHFPMP